MTHFEAYQWEDHVPRTGSWRFDLAAGLVALGLIAAALPDRPGNALFTASAQATPILERESLQPMPAAWTASAYCPAASAGYADS